MNSIVEPREPVALAAFLSLALYMAIVFGVFFYLGHKKTYYYKRA